MRTRSGLLTHDSIVGKAGAVSLLKPTHESRAKKAAVKSCAGEDPTRIQEAVRERKYLSGSLFFACGKRKTPQVALLLPNRRIGANEGKAAISPAKQRKTIDLAVFCLQNCRINCIISCITRICVFHGNFLVNFFDETFAMLDKSVYHIFGEDCARCVKNTRFSAKSPRAFGSEDSHPANKEARHRAIVPAPARILQFFTPNPSIMHIGDTFG